LCKGKGEGVDLRAAPADDGVIPGSDKMERRELSSPRNLKWQAPRVPRNTEERKALREMTLFFFLFIEALLALAAVEGQISPKNNVRPSLAVAIPVCLAVGGMVLLIPIIDRWSKTTCKTTRDGVIIGSTFHKYRDIRHVRFWSREEKGQTFRMMSLLRTSGRIWSVAIAPEIAEEDLHGLLAKSIPVLIAPPTQHERTMSRLVPGTWRMLIGVPFFLAGMFLALAAFVLGEKAIRDPYRGTPPATQPMTSTVPAESQPASSPEETPSKVRGRIYFWINIEMCVAVALASACFLLAGGLLYLWDRTYRLRQIIEYLANRAPDQEGGKTDSGS
jgi:hypothetical protein